MEGGFSEFIRFADISAMGDQEFRQVHVSAFHRRIEKGVAEFVWGADVSALGKQDQANSGRVFDANKP